MHQIKEVLFAHSKQDFFGFSAFLGAFPIDTEWIISKKECLSRVSALKLCERWKCGYFAEGAYLKRQPYTNSSGLRIDA
jgi:hypothetical protein